MANHIPYKIAEYLRNHFREDFLYDVKKVNNTEGRVFYLVEVDQDNFVHHLKFNEKGNLVKEDTRPAFPTDGHEEPFIDEGTTDPKDFY